MKTSIVAPLLIATSLLLGGCGPTRSSGDPRMARPEKRPENAVGVYLSSEQGGERWALIDEKGTQICQLPCSEWVAPKSKLRVQRDADRAADRKTLEMPELSYPPGTVVDVEVQRPPHTAGYVTLYVGGSVVLIGGFVTLVDGLIPNLSGETSIGPGGPVVMGVGGATIATGVVLLATVSGSSAYLEVTRSADAMAGVDLGPGVVHVDTAGLDVDVTPFGAAGTF